jgi:hypothetical protein
MAMILALASLLGYMNGDEPHQASRTIYESALETVSDGVRTADLGGQTSTSDFTNEVIRRIKTKVEVWSALADIERLAAPRSATWPSATRTRSAPVRPPHRAAGRRSSPRG